MGKFSYVVACKSEVKVFTWFITMKSVCCVKKNKIKLCKSCAESLSKHKTLIILKCEKLIRHCTQECRIFLSKVKELGKKHGRIGR